MKYNALVHAYNSLIYLSIHSFPLIPSFIYLFIYLFIHSFIHSFIHLFNKYTHYIHWKLYPLYLHYFTKWVWGKAGACIELRTLYSKLSSHDLKFSFVCFVVLCFCLCVCVCVCVCDCMVCLFVLLCISIIHFQVYLKLNFQLVPDIETTSGLDCYAIKKKLPLSIGSDSTWEVFAER